MASIIGLEDRINHLKQYDKESYKIFKRIYNVYFGIGSLKIPSELKNKVYKNFSQPTPQGNVETTRRRVQVADLDVGGGAKHGRRSGVAASAFARAAARQRSRPGSGADGVTGCDLSAMRASRLVSG